MHLSIYLLCRKHIHMCTCICVHTYMHACIHTSIPIRRWLMGYFRVQRPNVLGYLAFQDPFWVCLKPKAYDIVAMLGIWDRSLVSLRPLQYFKAHLAKQLLLASLTTLLVFAAIPTRPATERISRHGLRCSWRLLCLRPHRDSPKMRPLMLERPNWGPVTKPGGLVGPFFGTICLAQ